MATVVETDGLASWQGEKSSSLSAGSAGRGIRPF